ncbi:beta-galactosidase, partial [Candidatus Uhrbacteria bacterium]|nr:beta-galactosidase [Candidatus Uhrbacteria bacterium]
VTYAQYLGLDPVVTFERVLGDLRPAFVRIPVYWQRIETQKGTYDFAELDEIMERARASHMPVILAIGRKVPRWPECHTANPYINVSPRERDDALIEFLQHVITRYKDHPSLWRWQIENEPYFSLFGECERLSSRFIDREYALLDTPTPTQMGASGEQSLWIRAARRADIVGTSVYRTTYTPFFGYRTYPIPPWTYRLKAAWFADNRVVVSELQAEPWFARDIYTYSIKEQLALFNAATLDEHMRYVERIGMPEVSLWGVEWWYYLDAHEEPSVLDAARRWFNQSNP